MTEQDAVKALRHILDEYWSDNDYTDADVVHDLRAHPAILIALLPEGVSTALANLRGSVAAHDIASIPATRDFIARGTVRLAADFIAAIDKAVP